MSNQTTPPEEAQTPQPPPGDDYLGYGDYADTLWARILAAVNKDAEAIKKAQDKGRKNGLDGDPLVVGIFGEWGAGKSKLLSLVRERAMDHLETLQKTRHANVGFELTVPVFFQPWKYEHEPHLHVPMIMHITAALKDALKAEPGLLPAVQNAAKKTFWAGSKAAKLVHPGAQVASAVYPLLQTAVGSFSAFGTSLSLPDELGEWLEDAADATSALPEALDKLQKRKDNKAQERTKRQISHSSEGMYFYRIHEYLEKITRPGADTKLAEDLQDTASTKTTRINFVIFIDDLDRCLPEKAVETLELIKTIFNAESFAFVLALDEEVVERGIGHRYKDYALAGKKPEMPITGFEYLEKIVHLPFRLPALTRQQALDFMQRYEKGLLEERVKTVPFLAYNKESQRSQWIAQRTWLGAATSTKPCLAHLVVNSFDAFVPRKLIRIIELLHQVLDVLDKRGRIDKLRVNGTIDPRLLMAFLLLQLFHPDLYRTFRRTRVGFEEVLDAFNNETLNQDTSDLDLWRWAAIGYDMQQLAKQEPLPPVSYEKAVLMIGGIEAKARFKAQQIYLPIAQRLVEHRAAQRHVFDPLRLFASLKAGDIKSATFSERYSREYYSLLTQDGANALDLIDLEIMPAPVVADDAGEKLWNHTTMGAGMHTAPAHMGGARQTEMPTAPAEPSRGTTEQSKQPVPRPRRAGDAETLFNALVSTAQREQQSAPTNVGLKAGEWLDASSASELHQRLTKWLDGVSDAQRPEAMRRLLRGLQYLAPHISRDDGGIFWNLVKGVDHGGELGESLENMDQLQARELWADVRSTLGLDPRFDRETHYFKIYEDKASIPGRPLYLPAKRSSVWSMQNLGDDQSQAIEPIPGFVKVAYDSTFKLSDEKGQSTIDQDPFYVARTLTTVDQYAAFIADGGYHEDNAALWGGQGNAWRTGTWDKAVGIDEELKKRLASRPQDRRNLPASWDQQQAHGSRPVHGVNWFEARAYARWLDAKLRLNLNGIALPKDSVNKRYEVRLPTEAQWERAARAANVAKAHPVASKTVDLGYWPWVQDAATAKLTAHLQANTDASKIGRASVVGLFAPNPLGASDLAGNLWEWQDNLFAELGGRKAWERFGDQTDTDERAASERDEGDWLHDEGDGFSGIFALLALRGGSWGESADYANCWYRRGVAPNDCDNSVGFRLVLSLANLKSKT
jgi:formylglycine-generating enzyme required for sulfatase activity